MRLGLFPYWCKQQSSGRPRTRKAKEADIEHPTSLLTVLWMIGVRVQAVLLTTRLVPGIVCVLFFLLNCLLWAADAAGAVDFVVLLGLLITWFGLSLPLTITGAFFAFRLMGSDPFGERTNLVPTLIQQPRKGVAFSCRLSLLPFLVAVEPLILALYAAVNEIPAFLFSTSIFGVLAVVVVSFEVRDGNLSPTVNHC